MCFVRATAAKAAGFIDVADESFRQVLVFAFLFKGDVFEQNSVLVRRSLCPRK